MEKFYVYSSSLYRLVMIAFAIFVDWQVQSPQGEWPVGMYVWMSLYGVLLSLIRKNKWAAYAEFLILFALLSLYPTQYMLHYLLVLPLIQFVSADVKKGDLLLFTGIWGVFAYTKTGDVLVALMSGLAFYVVMSLFYSKFKQIDFLETKLFEERQRNVQLRKRMVQKEMESEEFERMLVRSKDLGEAQNIKQLQVIITEAARFFFDAYYACLYIKKPNSPQYVHTTEAGMDDRYDAPDVLEAADAHEDHMEGDMLQIRMQVEARTGQKEEWGVLRVYGKRTIVAASKQKAFLSFSEKDYELLATFVMQATHKLKEVMLAEKNKFLANYDSLTEIPNRRYFLERFEQYAVMAARGEDFALVLLDIDHFKRFNDVYGHQVGDKVLRMVAMALEDTVRKKVDIIGRLGGEEFGVLLFKPKDGAREVADRIRARVRELPAEEQITLSVGISRYGNDGTDWETLFNNADKAMYHAKASGRDRVVEYKDLEEQS